MPLARVSLFANHATMLSPKAIEELKAIYKRHYGEDLSDDEAWEMENRLIRIFAILAREPRRSVTPEKGSHVPSPLLETENQER